MSSASICQICGAGSATESCQLCGQLVCGDHYDHAADACAQCLGSDDTGLGDQTFG